MDLTHDWRCFQEVFYPERRLHAVKTQSSENPVYLVIEQDTVLSAFAEGEDLSDWIGSSFQEVSKRNEHREIVAYDRQAVDRWMDQSLEIPNFYGQVEFLRKSSKPSQHLMRSASNRFGSSKALTQDPKRHFLLEALHGWWSKVLPSSYGIFIRTEGTQGQAEQDFLLLIQRGSMDGLIRPDVSSLGPDRSKQPADIVKYLSEKYLVPVQGVFVPTEQWDMWSKNGDPWREIARSVKVNQTKLVPFRWALAMLMAVRGFFGF